MARLPSREDLGRRTVGPSAGTVNIPRADTSGLQRGVAALSSGAMSLAGSLQADEDKSREYEQEKRLLDFKLRVDQEYDTYSQGMPEGGAGFTDGWHKRYQKLAGEFVGKHDQNVPADFRGPTGLKLKQLETRYVSNALSTESQERERFTISDLEKRVGVVVNSVSVKPEKRAEYYDDLKRQIELAPLRPDVKRKYLEKATGELQTAYGVGRLQSAKTVADRRELQRELFPDGPPQPKEAFNGEDGAGGLQELSGVARQNSAVISDLPDYRGKDGPAAVRYNNPGAQWPGPSASKFGAVETVTLKDKQRNKIAVFPTAVHGAAAHFDLLNRMYTGKPLTALVDKWGGGNSPEAYAANVANKLGISKNTVITKEMLSDPEFAIPFAQAMAGHEAGKGYPLSPEGWQSGFEMFKAGSAQAYQPQSASIQTGSISNVIDPEYKGPFDALTPQQRLSLYSSVENDIKQQVVSVNRVLTKLESHVADGHKVSDEQIIALGKQVEDTGDPVTAARLTRMVGMASTIQNMQGMTPAQNEALINTMTERVPEPTPDQAKQIETMKAVAARQRAMIDNDALTWAHRTNSAGVQISQLNPAAPNFVDSLQDRMQQALTVSQQFGIAPQYFTKAEREALTSSLDRGGPQMVQFLGQLYQGFGMALGDVVKEIAPKQPELARAGMLVAYGGDPKAVQDIATTLQRRADPNYPGPPKKHDASMEATAKAVFGDFFDRLGPSERDAAMKSAMAIYEARVKDSSIFDGATYTEALNAVVGQRVVGRDTYGGIVDTKPGMLFGASGDKVMLPPNVKRDGWRQLFDSITEADIRESGLSMPTDATGKPLSLTKAVNGRIVQIAPNVYRFSMGDPAGVSDAPKWVMAGGPMAPAGSPRAAQDKGVPTITTPFELDFNKLGPIMQRRYPSYFLNQ